MNRRTVVLSTALVAAAAATALSQSNPRPVNWAELPKPFETESARNPSQVIPRPDGATLSVPAGFTIEEYQSEFIRPRYMVLGPSNEVLLADSGTREPGSVYVLKDGSKKKILEGLDRPYGLAVQGEWLYVAETTSVKRYKYDRKNLVATAPGEEIIPLKEYGRGHWTRTILFDRDGKKLYLNVGSQSNIDLNEPPMRAALHKFNPDGTGHQTVATGLRNPVGLRWYPGTSDLWVSVQERDGLGDDLVSDYVTKVREGGFYGWPIAYIGPHREPRHASVDEALVAKTLYPDVLLGAHVGALDIDFYTGQQFPQKYRGGMFVAMHGSWNRSKRIGYKVAFIPFKDGKPASGPEDFLTGWMTNPEQKEVWGRPVGLLPLQDGSLLVSDDGGGKIWRVSYKGASASAP